MPVQCCPRPADHARCVFGTTAFGSLLGDDSELAVDHLWIHRWSTEAGALGFRCGDAGVDAFGSGKTTAAKLLAQKVPGAVIVDPEEIGALLRPVLQPVVPVQDFQE